MSDEWAPGNRLRVALTGLTMAEYFRDEGRDVLFFVDNIYRYTLAGTEVSALLGRMLQRWAISLHLLKKWVYCRSVLPQLKRVLLLLSKRFMYQRWLDRSITSNNLCSFDATVVLSRQIAEFRYLSCDWSAGFYKRQLDPLVIGQEHYDVARKVQVSCNGIKNYRHYCDFGMDELSEEDNWPYQEHVKCNGSCLNFLRCWSFYRSPGKYVSLKDTIAGFKGIIAGDYDAIPEQAFYMVGTLMKRLRKQKEWNKLHNL